MELKTLSMILELKPLILLELMTAHFLNVITFKNYLDGKLYQSKNSHLTLSFTCSIICQETSSNLKQHLNCKNCSISIIRASRGWKFNHKKNTWMQFDEVKNEWACFDITEWKVTPSRKPDPAEMADLS
jgi:hypothetical protein